MSIRLSVVGLSTLVLLSLGASANAEAMSAAAFMKAVNTNADKTISKAELDTYARRASPALDTDNDKTLNDNELKGRLSSAGMAMA